jgi:hypothetical protein
LSDTAETGTVVALHHEQPPRMSGGQFERGVVPKAIVPVDFDGAWRIANITFKSGMAPKGFKNAEQCMVAILHGLEVGLTPMNALQSIAIINGRPTIWGDGLIGLIEASGLLEDKDEHFEGEGTTLKAVCILKRKGRKTAIRQEFSVSDAKKAGLHGKEGPWQGYPPRMLQMRARSWAVRDGFSDVLKGIHFREEVEDIARSQPNTEPEPIDDGGGPPIPPSAQIAKPAEEKRPRQLTRFMYADSGYGMYSGASRAVGFPGLIRSRSRRRCGACRPSPSSLTTRETGSRV